MTGQGAEHPLPTPASPLPLSLPLTVTTLPAGWGGSGPPWVVSTLHIEALLTGRANASLHLEMQGAPQEAEDGMGA